MAIKGASHGVRGRGSYNVGVKLEGQIFKFNYLTQHTDVLLAGAARGAQKSFAEAYRDAVIKNIKNGGKKFHYKGHSPGYAKYKAKKGGGSRMLYWDGLMAKSVIIKDSANKTRYAVGIESNDKPGYHTAENTLTVSEYANILEHGRPPYMPARPVFGDTFKETMGGMKGLKRHIEVGVISHMAKAGIRVNRI